MQYNSSSDASSSSAQCGLCGACGTMPPWAPEVIAKSTPAERQALERRLDEARKRFISVRDARLAAQEKQQAMLSERASEDDDGDGDDDQTTGNNEIQQQKDVANDQSDADRQQSRELATPESELVSPDLSITPQASESINETDTENENKNDPTNNPPLQPGLSAATLTDLDSDADSFHTADDEETATERFDVTLQEEHLSTIEVAPNLPPTTANEQNTVEKDVHPESSSGPDPRKQTEQKKSRASAVPSSSDFAPFQSNSPSFTTPTTTPKNTTADSVPPTLQLQTYESSATTQRKRTADISSEPSAKSNPVVDDDVTEPIQIMTMQSFSPNINTTSNRESVNSWTSDNLEEILLSQNSMQRRQRRPTPDMMNQSPDVIPKNGRSIIDSSRSISASPQAQVIRSDRNVAGDDFQRKDPVRCEDCQVWRNRVIQLEAKVESLTSSLASREMEVAHLKSQIDEAGKYVPKSEARLIQECEGLRVTTEFLFQKLERYERTLSGRKGDVH